MDQDPFKSDNSAAPSQEFMQSFQQSVKSQTLPDPPQSGADSAKSRPRWLLPAIAAGAAILIIILVLILTLKPKNSSTDFYDENALSEVLNPDFAAAIKENPYASYETETVSTRFLNYPPAELANSLNLSFESLQDPATDPNLEPVGALNSNALNYYLDSENIVVVSATYDAADDSPVVFVIYAGSFASSNTYSVFYPDAPDLVFTMNRTELFNNLSGVPEFYVLKQGDN